MYVHDLEGARDFYHGTLGLPVINYAEGKHLFLRVGESVLLIFNPDDAREKTSPPAHYGGGKQHFAFEIADNNYGECKKTIEDKGIIIIDEVTWPGGTKSFYFNDPEGNVLEILPPRGVWD